MAAVSGLGSGLDISGIVQGLMSIESQPLVAMQKKEANYYSQITAYGQLSSSLAGFQSSVQAISDATATTQITSSDTAKLTAVGTSGGDVPEGNYTVVVNALAQSHKLASQGYTDQTSVIGSGTLSLTVDGTTADFNFSDSKTTLGNLVDAINTSEKNPGITAAMINIDGQSKLVLTSKQTGASHAIITSGTLAETLNLTETQAAQDAEFVLDGFTVKSSTNTSSTAIQGVTLTALKADPEQPINVVVSRDRSAVMNAMRQYVQAYNTLNKSLTDLSNGALKGDSTLRTIKSRIQNMMTDRVDVSSSPFHYVGEMGVTFLKDGTLAFNSSMFSGALNQDYNGVMSFLSDKTSGYTTKMKNAIEGILDRSNGIIQTRTDGINSNIKRLKSQEDSFQKRLTQIQDRYTKQYNSLDSLVAGLQQTNTFLTQQFSKNNSSS